MKCRRLVLVFGTGAFVLAGLIWCLCVRAPRPPTGTAAAPTVRPPALADTSSKAPLEPVISPTAAASAGPAATPAAPVSAAPAVTQAPSAAPAAAITDALPRTVVPAPADEVAATERIYLAHAPLRTTEVADPNSETNRRILETMVTKGLAASSTAGVARSEVPPNAR